MGAPAASRSEAALGPMRWGALGGGVPAGPCLSPAPAFGPLFPAAAPLGPGPAGSHTP